MTSFMEFMINCVNCNIFSFFIIFEEESPAPNAPSPKAASKVTEASSDARASAGAPQDQSEQCEAATADTSKAQGDGCTSRVNPPESKKSSSENVPNDEDDDPELAK